MSARNAPDGAFRIRCIMLILVKLNLIYLGLPQIHHF